MIVNLFLKFFAFNVVLCLLIGKSFAREAVVSFDNGLSKIWHVASHPGDIADAIVIFDPVRDYSLNIPSKEDILLDGVYYNDDAMHIGMVNVFHRAGVMIAPLKKGHKMKLFLKKFPGRSGYYLIGIFPIDFPSRGYK